MTPDEFAAHCCSLLLQKYTVKHSKILSATILLDYLKVKIPELLHEFSSWNI